MYLTNKDAPKTFYPLQSGHLLVIITNFEKLSTNLAQVFDASTESLLAASTPKFLLQ